MRTGEDARRYIGKAADRSVRPTLALAGEGARAARLSEFPKWCQEGESALLELCCCKQSKYKVS